MTFADFHRVLTALTAIDRDDVLVAALDLSAADWQRFRANPAVFILQASEPTAATIYAVAAARSAAEPTPLSADTCRRIAHRWLQAAELARHGETFEGRRAFPPRAA